MKIYISTRSDTELANDDQSLGEQFRFANSSGRVTIVDTPSDADIVLLIEQFKFRCHRSVGAYSSCPFIRTFASRILVINYDDYGRGFLPGLYTSLNSRNFDPCRHRAICYPKTINSIVESEQPQVVAPRFLASFQGATASHGCRAKLFRAVNGDPRFAMRRLDQAFHSHDIAQKASYRDSMLSSLFVLCPRGYSPATYRLFEAMALGRCPIIISDDWIPIAGIDWDSCSIRVPERNIDRIPELLEAQKNRAASLGAAARSIWEGAFSQQSRFQRYCDLLLELKTSGAALQSIESLQGIWNERKFLKSNGWTIGQRIASRVLKAINR